MGGAKVLGINVRSDPRKVKANVGIVPESESPPSYLTAAEYLEFVARLRNLDEVEEKVTYWLNWFGISEKRDSLCKDLSKGQRQKVMLAGAFIHDPKLLFLDEPFVNLDPIYQRKCRELLMDIIGRGGTIFLCTHILEVAERLCTRVAIIDHGHVLAAGRVEDLKEYDAETLEDVFIRLVGTSMAEVEAIEDGAPEEE
jgi:ABC-2 type transport system ATP-binding protein